MSKPKFNPLVVALACLTLFGLLMSPFGRGVFSTGSEGAPARSDSGHVTHVVLFQWKSTADPDLVVMAHKRMMALRNQCLHPKRGHPYIVSFKGGADHSPEGQQHGATHGYVVQFASLEDRDYYVKSDPAHQTFKASIEDIVEKATVVDFTDGFY